MAKVVTLGEIMLRLSTTLGARLQLAEDLQVHYGGGEANVAISLANYGHEAYLATVVPENGLGMAVKKHLQRFSVHSDYVVTNGPRLGTYYMETGVSERAASVIYDRAGSSFAATTSLQWDLKKILQDAKVLHMSGITAALSPAWQQLSIEIAQTARNLGVKVSFDVNYRGMLWTQKECGQFLQKMLPLVDYCSAGSMDARYLLNVEPFAGEANSKEERQYYYEKMHQLFPNIEVFYATYRKVQSASSNDLTGTIYNGDGEYFESGTHHIEPIVDRVGGGDAFSGGVLHGLIQKWSLQDTVNFGTAASALKHTVHGDCNQFSELEVQNFLKAGSGKIIR
ncbi:sugar kinase [Enterococcus timonensis]|uniref:sugar kinase n=1 Tax=Enterococcus timonensis TaxID=1852364 RepID=UPI0008DA43EB|nr:sugar kinase [Enterococcus timonensis]